jgi:uncharacterized lipoprotein YddW (UPF0748 family)
MNLKMMTAGLLSSLILGTLALAQENKPALAPEQEIRAVWITRNDYKTPEDITKIVRNCAAYNLNILLFQVRGNGTVYYKSDIEPWAWELSKKGVAGLGENPGWDPLETAIKEAKKYHVELHAWLNTMPGWKGEQDPPENVPQLWNTHRDWFMRDKAGNIMIPTGKNKDWYRFLSPGNPEVQDYIRDVYTEVVKKYPVDGVHFDYIRYPGEIGDYSYDSASLAEFKKLYMGTPDNFPDEWSQFRRDNIAALVSKTYMSVTAARPGIKVSAAVIANRDRAKSAHYTSASQWAENGTIDILMPMSYTSDLFQFRRDNLEQIKNARGRYVCPGIGIGKKWAATPEAVVEQVETARAIGAKGITFFEYNGLFPQHKPSVIAEFLLKGPFARRAEVPSMPWR